MDILISTFQLKYLLEQAAELGAKHALARSGKLKPYLKKSEAFRLFGRKNVEHWIEAGLIKPRKDGNHSANWRIDRIEAEAVAKAAEALYFLFKDTGRPATIKNP